MTLKHVFAMGESRLPGDLPHYSFAHNPIDNLLSLPSKRSADRSMPWGRLDDYFFTSTEVTQMLGASRQTLWRCEQKEMSRWAAGFDEDLLFLARWRSMRSSPSGIRLNQ